MRCSCAGILALQPPLLNRPGMGAKLVTYYRKRDASDSDHQKLKQGAAPLATCSMPDQAVLVEKFRSPCLAQRRYAGELARCNHWVMMMTRPSLVRALNVDPLPSCFCQSVGARVLLAPTFGFPLLQGSWHAEPAL